MSRVSYSMMNQAAPLMTVSWALCELAVEVAGHAGISARISSKRPWSATDHASAAHRSGGTRGPFALAVSSLTLWADTIDSN